MAYVEEALELYTYGASRVNSVTDIPIYNNYGFVLYLDTSKFVNPTFYFEVVGKAATVGNDTVFSLYDLGTSDDATTTGTQVSGTELTFTSTTNSRSRTASSISLTSGNRYILKARQTTAVTTSVVYGARIIVVDNIGGSWSVNETRITMCTPNYTSTGTSYAEVGSSTHFDYDSSKYSADTISCYLDVSLKSTGGTAYVELWNNTDSSQVAEVSTTATNITRVRSGSFSLTDGKEYTLRFKTSSGSYTTTVSGAFIILQSNGSITAHRMYKRSGTAVTVTTTAYGDSGCYILYTSANYPSTPTAYYFATIKSNSTGVDIYAHLFDDTSNLGEVNTQSLTVDSYISSSSITINNGYEYRTRYKMGASGNGSAYSCALILDVTFAGGPTERQITKNSDARIKVLAKSITKNADTRIKSAGVSATKFSNAFVVLDVNLKARYDMQTVNGSDLKDLSGYENDGQPDGGVTIGGTTGIYLNSTQFDGTDDFFTLGQDTSIANITTNNLSLVAWVYITEARYSAILCGNDSEDSSYGLFITSDGKVDVKLKLSGTVYTKTFGAANLVSLNAWHQVVFTFDGTNWNVYVDSVAQTPQIQAGTINNYSQSIVMGRYSP